MSNIAFAKIGKSIKFKTSYSADSYTCIDRTPYVYLIGWSKYNKWYYGRRTRKYCEPNELWSKYFTSSIHVKNFRKLYGEPDIIEIRKIFNDIQSCEKFEEGVIRKLKLHLNPNWLNKSAIISNLPCGNTLGMCTVIDKNGNTFQVSIDDPRYISGELVGATKGYTIYKNKITEEKKFLKFDDELVLNGLYVGINYGKTQTLERRLKHSAAVSKEKNPEYGKKFKWINNGIKNKKLYYKHDNELKNLELNNDWKLGYIKK